MSRRVWRGVGTDFTDNLTKPALLSWRSRRNIQQPQPTSLRLGIAGQTAI
ncbi:hypothetical protein MC7420_2532 [Coleofasciculus chthonoplastes PCC 7420]|uniref:Uncharacterized protein n=2 Tax=Coleofasciculus chthonoplastes TaxID=64178 RepID=B4VZT0_9CYAN|nr:hypothetical protein MC7420_2532 [Coleofasciculus chthonoplastes PCC 7420]